MSLLLLLAFDFFRYASAEENGMKLLFRRLERDGTGSIAVVPEDDEDIWHAYNLIQEGDKVRSSTLRKVTSETATGTTSSQRVHTTLTIAVESIDYDTGAGTLHIKGKNVEENQFVKVQKTKQSCLLLSQ